MFESSLEGLACWDNERNVWSGQENEYIVVMEYDVFTTSLCDPEPIVGSYWYKSPGGYLRYGGFFF